jgi:acetyl coenzyme A synthetase (ADP forming)-like protein
MVPPPPGSADRPASLHEQVRTASAARWETDVVLRDGGVVHLRPITPADGPDLATFVRALSPESRRFRFFSPIASLTASQLEHLTHVDQHDRVAFVAEVDGALVGAARYDREPGTDQAEVGFVVADDHQGRGIGTVLLEHLAAAAREHSLTRFEAHVLSDNWRMLEVLRAAGFEERARVERGEVLVELHIEPTDAARAAIEGREHHAEAASVARLLNPRCVAVVGAGRRRDNVGHQVLRNLLDSELLGAVHPVNPSTDAVAGVQAFPTVSAIPGPVDLAVVAVPAPSVMEVARDCAAKGVHGLVVLSAGFGEVGDRDTEAALRRFCRRHGMRLVGPNCIGVVNTAIGLDATFAPTRPVPGPVAMQSQSGAVGILLLERSAEMGLGVSTFVSVGNKADVSGNDLLQFWEDDPATEVVLLYLESFGNPRKFARLARRVSRRKPIVAVKSGRSSAGVRAASSHTAAMASPDVAVDALFRQAGVIRVDTLDELFEVAMVLSSQPLPAGRNVAIVGNSGGPGILAADACAASDLSVPELSATTQEALRAVVDTNAAVTNPVDLVASATPDTYEQALRIVLADDGVDAAIVIATRTFAAPPDAVAAAVRRVAGEATKPLVGCFLAADVPQLLGDEASARRVPVFETPEPAARALGRAATYRAWRQRPPGRVVDLPGLDLTAARSVIDAFLEATPDGGWLSTDATAQLLTAVGVPVLRSRAANDGAEAERLAAAIGFPVALKASGAQLVHKSDVGGVHLDLRSEEEVRRAHDTMRDRLGARMTGALVQEMAPPGVETILGLTQDPLFGPLVMFGMGGTATELIGDRAFRILPVTDADAGDLVRSLRTSPLLFGYRGTPAVAVGALEGAVQRVARLAAAAPELLEMDVNPLTVSPEGVVAVDARARVAPLAPSLPPDLRRMG